MKNVIKSFCGLFFFGCGLSAFQVATQVAVCKDPALIAINGACRSDAIAAVLKGQDGREVALVGALDANTVEPAFCRPDPAQRGRSG